MRPAPDRKRLGPVLVGFFVLDFVLIVAGFWHFVGDGYRETAARIAAASARPPLPEPLARAIVAADDPTFLTDGRSATLRRIFGGYFSAAKVKGQPTISTRLVRLAGADASGTVHDLLTAITVDAMQPKAGILAAYAHSADVGIIEGAPRAGLAEAAKGYLGKPLDSLTLAESALLAGLVENPILYSPSERPEEARKRRDEVLRTMLERGLITRAELDAATAG